MPQDLNHAPDVHHHLLMVLLIGSVYLSAERNHLPPVQARPPDAMLLELHTANVQCAAQGT